MAGRGERAAAFAFTIVVALGVLTGCGGSDPTNERGSEPKRGFTPASEPGALQEPGTEIADGIHVQPDSALVAAAFPVVDPFDGTATPSGWQAVVAVQGDPIAVWDGYVAELGIDDVAGAKQACTVGAPATGSDDATNHQRFLTEPVLDGEIRLDCFARIGDVTVSLASGAVGCVRPNLSDDPCELRSGSSLYLRRAPGGERTSADDEVLGTDELRLARAEADLPDERGTAGTAPATGDPIQTDPGGTTTVTRQPPDRHPGPIDIPDGPVVAPDLQGSGPSNLPGEGDRIDDGIDYYLGVDGDDAPPAVLPKGAESLIAPAMLLDCNSGLVAVVELPQPPAQAVEAFTTNDPEGASDVQTGETGSRTWATRFFDTAGGYKLQLTAVDGSESGSSYVLATECGD